MAVCYIEIPENLQLYGDSTQSDLLDSAPADRKIILGVTRYGDSRYYRAVSVDYQPNVILLALLGRLNTSLTCLHIWSLT